MHERLIGVERHESAMESAKVYYMKVIYPVSGWMCSPEISSNVDMKSISWVIKKSNQARCQSLLRGFYRFNVEISFMFGVLLLSIAAFYDGAIQRSIGKHEFGYNNPVAFHLVTHSIIMILGLHL